MRLDTLITKGIRKDRIEPYGVTRSINRAVKKSGKRFKHFYMYRLRVASQRTLSGLACVAGYGACDLHLYMEGQK